MTTETITIQTGDRVEPHQVEVKPITLVCSGADMMVSKLGYPERLEITSTMTIYHAQRVKVLHPKFAECWERIFANQDHKPSCNPDEIRQAGTGLLHLAGLIDMALKLTDMKIPLAFIHPEAHLHPAIQGPLSDFFIYLTEVGKK